MHFKLDFKPHWLPEDVRAKVKPSHNTISKREDGVASLLKGAPTHKLQIVAVCR